MNMRMRDFWDYLTPVRILPVIINLYVFLIPMLPVWYKIGGLFIYLIFMGLDLWFKPDKKALLEYTRYCGVLAIAILSVPMLINYNYASMYMPIIYNLVLGFYLFFLNIEDKK